jgi:CBS domain containing-hemolysin-like protein
MNGHIWSWLSHPVTVALVAAATAALFAVIEVLLRSLATMGNVRFQGMLEDHGQLLPVDPETHLHLSRLLDVLRWLQIVCVGLLWFLVFRIPGLDLRAAVAAAVLVPVLAVLVSTLIGAVSEDRVATLVRLVRPVVWPALKVVGQPVGAAADTESNGEEEEASEREIQAFLEAGQAAGIFERDEGEFVGSLVDFFDTVVREVMTPRTEMVAVPDTATVNDVLEVMATTNMSRVPVYHETVDRVVGVVHVKSLVRHQKEGGETPVTELVHGCLVVPENRELDDLLRDFQQERQQMAIVVDEYGGTSGLVTLEDVLEEIVGEIQDEHEPTQPPEWQEVEPGVYRLQGRAPLELLAELYGVPVEVGDIDTVGGLVFSSHGTVPETGTEVAVPALGMAFTVDEMDERRIVSVTVRRVAPADPDVPGEGG